MKYFSLLFLLTFAGCGVTSHTQQANTTPDTVTPSDPASREIVQRAEDGSCFNYELTEGGNVVDVPMGVTMASTCAASPPVLSKDKTMLAFTNEAGVHVYEIGADVFSNVAYIYEDIPDGVGPLVWNDIDDRLASVEVSQQTYPMLTQICVQNLDTTLVTCTDAKVNFSCGSVCGAEPDDLQFSGDREITYITWDDVPYDLDGTIEAIKTLTIE